jgi:hypothetical protein
MHTVSYRVSDAAGNVSTCDFTIQVLDNESPFITCPPDKVVNTAFDVCGNNVSFNQPMVSDNCGVVSLEMLSGQESNSFFTPGIHLQSYRVTDESGNYSECDFSITVNDNEPMLISCPDDITIDASGACNVWVNVAPPAVYDNCDPISIVNNITGTADASGVYSSGQTPVNWTVTDSEGIPHSCTTNVIVSGAEGPDACTETVTIYLDEIGHAFITPDMFPGSGSACGEFTVTDVQPRDFYCDDLGLNTVVVSLEDEFGNTSTCSGHVQVNDDIVPELSCSNITVPVDNMLDNTATLTLYAPLSLDNCEYDGDVFNSMNMEDHITATVHQGSPLSIYWFYTDPAGNETNCVQMISAVLPAVCVAPHNLQSTILTSKSVRLTWDAVPGALGYRIKGRKAGTTAFAKLNTVNPLRTLNALIPGATYEWKVQTKCADGSVSPFSELVSFTMPLVREIEMKASMEIFPNPANTAIHIKLIIPDEQDAILNIVNSLGEPVLSRRLQLSEGIQVMTEDISRVAAGVYYVEIVLDNARLSKRLIKVN